MVSIIFLVIIAGFYAAVIIPQQRRAKALRETLAKLTEGDEVVTTGGVYGAIAEVDGDIIWLEVAPDVELKVLRSAIAGKAPASVDDDDDADDDEDDVTPDSNVDDEFVDDEA